MCTNKITKQFFKVMIVILVFAIPFYLEHYYTPRYSPYENILLNKIVAKCDSVMMFINNNIDSPTDEKYLKVKQEFHEIINDKFFLIREQTVMNKIIKDEYTLTRGQMEILNDKIDQVSRWEKRFSVSVLENLFALQDFSPLLKTARGNFNGYQGKDIKIKYVDSKYFINLEGGSIVIPDGAGPSEAVTMESVASVRFFLIFTADQKYYLRRPWGDYQMSGNDKSLEVKSTALNFKLTGRIIHR
ncbi:MAG: hypothetical protein ACOWWO_07560 [Peptococcaceae bacterium]